MVQNRYFRCYEISFCENIVSTRLCREFVCLYFWVNRNVTKCFFKTNKYNSDTPFHVYYVTMSNRVDITCTRFELECLDRVSKRTTGSVGRMYSPPPLKHDNRHA